MRHPTVVEIGGLSLVVGALTFVGIFAYLAASMGYPDVLDRPASEALPALLATGSVGRAIWAIYALVPLVFVLAGVAAFEALRHTAEARMRLALHLATLSAFASVIGLARWPSIHWELARAYISAGPEVRSALEAIFLGLNVYLGNYLGEFLGEFAFNGFFLLSAVTALSKDSGFPKWFGYFGVIAALAGLTAMFRNVTATVGLIAEFNNYLLPIWMITFGIMLARYSSRRISSHKLK
jgi:hypothetical protein